MFLTDAKVGKSCQLADTSFVYGDRGLHSRTYREQPLFLLWLYQPHNML